MTPAAPVAPRALRSRRAAGLVLALAAAAVAIVAAPGVAVADVCRNVCDVADGDLCGAVKQVVTMGEPVRLRVTRQRGTCGGGAPIALAELTLTWSRTAAGPFTAMPVRADGADLVFTPDQRGAYFLSLAARDQQGKPDRLVLLAIDPADATAQPVAVRFKLRPPRGLSLARIALRVRRIPDGVDDSFPRTRWPLWRDNDVAGKSARVLRLPPGRYELAWAHLDRRRPRHGIEVVEVTAAGDLKVPLHPAAP